MVTIQLPCYVGDVVFCKIDDHKEDYLDECYVKSIEIEKDFPHDGMADPLYTVICDSQTKKEFNRFFASEFGKTIFTLEQYFERTRNE